MKEEYKHKFEFPRLGDRNVVIIFIIVLSMLVSASIWVWHEYRTTPPYIDSEKYPIKGIDVSRHNGMMNFDAAVADGVEFVFIKASEGKSLQDENFRINYEKAGRAGMKIGAYHFFRFDVDGVEQAHNLLGAIKNCELDLGVAIDVEKSGNPDGISDDIVQRELRQMVDYLTLRGVDITLYTNKDGYYQYCQSSDFAICRLWICSFSQNPINAEWTFWQYNHRGKVKGIRGDVDLNVFNGSREDWEKYCESIKIH